jgi:hypothetical protein
MKESIHNAFLKERCGAQSATMTAVFRVGRLVLLGLAFCIAVCAVASAEPAEIWNGTIDARDPPGSYGGHTVGNFTLTEAPDGIVSGTGSGEWDASIDIMQVTITVTGTRDVDAFDLTIDAAWGGRFTARAPIHGTVAEGTLHRPDDPVNPRGQVRLQSGG